MHYHNQKCRRLKLLLDSSLVKKAKPVPWSNKGVSDASLAYICIARPTVFPIFIDNLKRLP